MVTKLSSHGKAILILVAVFLGTAEAQCANTKVFYPGGLKTRPQDRVRSAIEAANSGQGFDLCFEGFLDSEDAVISDLQAANTDVLIYLNHGLKNKPFLPAAGEAVAAALEAGSLKHFFIWDRYAAFGGEKLNIPGLPKGNVSFEYGLEPLSPVSPDSAPNNGPAGTVGSWEGVPLNNKPEKHWSWSSRGEIDESFVMEAGVSVFFVNSRGRATDAFYCYGNGTVYYSTTPIDYFITRTSDDLPYEKARIQFANTLAFALQQPPCDIGAPDNIFNYAGAATALSIEAESVEMATVTAVKSETTDSLDEHREILSEVRLVRFQAVALLAINSFTGLAVVGGLVWMARRSAGKNGEENAGGQSSVRFSDIVRLQSKHAEQPALVTGPPAV